MNIYKLIILLSSAFLLASCASEMAGFKKDYRVLNKNEIKQMFAGNTISSQKGSSQYLTYYSRNGKYFTVLKNGNGQIKEGDYNYGKWKLKTITVHGYKFDHICKNSTSSGTDCSTVFINGGKWYLDRFDIPPISVRKGASEINNVLISSSYEDTKSLIAYEKVIGKNAKITEKKKQVIAMQKAKIKKSNINTELASAVVAKGMTAGLNALFSGSGSSSRSSASSAVSSSNGYYITNWGYDFSGDDRIWGRNGVKLNNGKEIYTWLERESYGSRCYKLFVQGAFHGGGSNCNNSINNNWAVSCSGSGQFWVQGDHTDVVKAIVRRCGN